MSLELVFRDQQKCGYWKETVCHWRETASVLFKPRRKFLEKSRNAFLSRVFAAGEVGQTGLPLSPAVEMRVSLSSRLLREQEGLGDLDSEYIAPGGSQDLCAPAQAILMPTVTAAPGSTSS